MKTMINVFNAYTKTYEDVFSFIEQYINYKSLEFKSDAYNDYLELITNKATIRIEKAVAHASQWFIEIKDHLTGIVYGFGCNNLIFAFKPHYTTLNTHVITA